MKRLIAIARARTTDAFVWLLIAGAIALGAIGSIGSPSVASAGPSQAEKLAVRLDKILDSIPERRFDGEASVYLWALEILPYFEYEGLTSSVKLPDSIDFQPQLNGRMHNHILGQAGCVRNGGGPVTINARVANPVSARYGDTWFLPTLVHELIHVQGGGFCFGSSERLESTTQIATFEVLAAMANHGNKDAAYALMDELRDTALAAVHYEALRDGDVERYYELHRKIHPSPLEQARTEKFRRFWNENAQTRSRFKFILNTYSAIPLRAVFSGLETGEIPNLYMGEWVDVGTFSHDTEPPDKYAARVLKVDDLVYFLEHAEEIATALSG